MLIGNRGVLANWVSGYFFCRYLKRLLDQAGIGLQSFAVPVSCSKVVTRLFLNCRRIGDGTVTECDGVLVRLAAIAMGLCNPGQTKVSLSGYIYL